MTVELPPPADEFVVACPRCAAPNLGNADFCDDCGRPLSPTATLDPIKAIQSEGFVFRQMVSGRRSGLVLLGAWMAVVPGFSYILFGGSSPAGGPALALAAFVSTGLGLTLLYRVTANYLRRRSRPAQD